MNEMQKREVEERLEDYVMSITKPSKGKNMYVCPLCGSGKGRNHTGAFSIFRDKSGKLKWHCHSCDKGGDIWDLIGAYEQIFSKADRYKRGAKLFGIDDTNEAAHVTITPPPAADSLSRDVPEPEPETDYTEFFKEAAAHINDTDYHRGLSDETLRKYNIGYVAAWTHPKNPQAPASPRLIIPTSKYSYVARDTRGNAACKAMKAGHVHLFNLDVLDVTEKPVYIVEGEIDALSILDVGGEAVGLGSTSNIGKLVDYIKEGHRPKSNLIIALDNDDPGREATEKLKSALNDIDGITYATYNPYGDSKDANEAMTKDRAAFTAAIAEGEVLSDDKKAERRAELERKFKQDSAAAALPQFLQYLREGTKNNAIPTGYHELDEILNGGLRPGLYVIGAISSLGKTTFSLQAADYIAKSGRDVLFFSLEMARNELIAKSISRLTFNHVNQFNAANDAIARAKSTIQILDGRMVSTAPTDDQALIQFCMKNDTYGYMAYAQNLHISEGIGNIGVKEIAEKVYEYRELTGRAPVVVIDYLQILAPYSMTLTDKQNTDKAVLELKRLSRDAETPILAISSFNRDNYTDPVNMAAFKESGAIEYSADVLIGIQYKGMDYKKEWYTGKDGNEHERWETRDNRLNRIRKLFDENNKRAADGEPVQIEVKVLKNRNGNRGCITMNQYSRYNCFTAYSDPSEEWYELPSKY